MKKFAIAFSVLLFASTTAFAMGGRVQGGDPNPCSGKQWSCGAHSAYNCWQQAGYKHPFQRNDPSVSQESHELFDICTEAYINNCMKAAGC